MRREDGAWGLSPAYDIPVQMNGLGVQAIQISPDPAYLNRFDPEHAVATAPRFGMRSDEALSGCNRIAGHVALWRDVFAEVGVTEGISTIWRISSTARRSWSTGRTRRRRRTVGLMVARNDRRAPS
jgi:hypothetical protein